MIIERHVFGSVSGYKTLAKGRSLSAEECRALESFSFGQPNASEYLASLGKQVAFWIRPLGTRRRALTRIMPGPVDDQGRATVLMVTAIASVPDWNNVLFGDFSLLLGVKSLWHWDGEPELNPVDLPVIPPSRISVNGRSVDKILNLISYIESGGSKQRSIVTRDRDVTADELRCLEMLIPPSVRGTTSMAYRSLNPRLGSTLNCIASGISLNRGVHLVDPAAPVERSLYARVLADAGLGGPGVDPSFVAGYGEFGRHGRGKGKSASSMASQPVIVVPAQQGRSKIAFLSGWIATVILLITLGIFWLQQDNVKKKAAGDVRELRRESAMKSDVIEDLVAGYPLPMDAKERKNTLATLDDRVKDIEEGAAWLEDVNRRGEVMAEIEPLLADSEKGKFDVLEKLEAALNRDKKVAQLYSRRVGAVQEAADLFDKVEEELDRSESTVASMSPAEVSETTASLQHSLGQLAALGFGDSTRYGLCTSRFKGLRMSVVEQHSATIAMVRDVVATLNEVQLAFGSGATPDVLQSRAQDLEDSLDMTVADDDAKQLATTAAKIAGTILDSGRMSKGKWVCELPEDVRRARDALIAAEVWVDECHQKLAKERSNPALSGDEIRKIDEKLKSIEECKRKLQLIRLTRDMQDVVEGKVD